jgi:hypothetical protein
MLGEPTGPILELGFGGVHAVPLRMVGFEVTVVARDEVERGSALARAGDPVYHEVPRQRYQAVIAPEGTDLTGIRAERRLIVYADGSILG